MHIFQDFDGVGANTSCGEDYCNISLNKPHNIKKVDSDKPVTAKLDIKKSTTQISSYRSKQINKMDKLHTATGKLKQTNPSTSFYKPSSETKWESLRNTIYNIEKGTVLMRKPRRCLEIFIYYIAFYSAICVLWAICWCCFYFTVLLPQDQQPVYLMSDLQPTINTGIPNPVIKPLDEYSHFSYSIYDFKRKKEELIEFLEIYKKVPVKFCNELRDKFSGGTSCKYKFSDYGPCTEENNFNLHTGAPCLFLKINKIIGWKPIFYKYYEYPDSIPSSIKDLINQTSTENQIWISCEGAFANDKSLLRNVSYFPHPFIPGFVFPYSGYNKKYLFPVIAVKFEVPPNETINIICKLWAKNIIINTKISIGCQSFTLKVRH